MLNLNKEMMVGIPLITEQRKNGTVEKPMLKFNKRDTRTMPRGQLRNGY